MYILGAGLRAKKNQGAKRTSKKRGKGRKERERGKKENEGAKQTVFLWLPRFINFWLSNHINQEAEKERQFFWLPKRAN